jgi:hypothetical protein
VIAYNGDDGVLVEGGSGDLVQRNSIFGHANGLGIELVNGGNGSLSFPVLTSATSDGYSTTVVGLLQSVPNAAFVLEFFANPVCSASGFGEGEQFLGSATVITDSKGTVTFWVTFVGAVAPGKFVAATATDANGNTSAFSNCVGVTEEAAAPAFVPGTQKSGVDQTTLPGPVSPISASGRSSLELAIAWKGSLYGGTDRPVQRHATDVLFGKWSDETRLAGSALFGLQ